MSKTKWTRRETTTRGADPTVVVSWTDGEVTLVEFQTVVSVDFETHLSTGVVPTRQSLAEQQQRLGAALHEALERAWDAEQELLQQTRADAIDDAERPRVVVQGGWNKGCPTCGTTAPDFNLTKSVDERTEYVLAPEVEDERLFRCATCGDVNRVEIK